ncbi:hypothetical protein HW561_23330 [Rhodobacteraceae bacterium B1Z28]|uniref:Uncharacterized protein n=1 Tax=Ruegeria haliotis TaxID=2747601 RepID=A0ABX2PWW8_9RHOB|nr:hypothetical protein [Ruegeria haliotis]NVO58705.1 hypothetical protein [Ruegeria haliotis]
MFKIICENNNLDFLSILKKENKFIEKESFVNDVFIIIFVVIIFYVRIYINNIKLIILNSGGKIYYFDIDSIVINIELLKEYLGNELGKLKLENVIKEGYFIVFKIYLFVIDKNEIVKKVKGVFFESLIINDFKEMYYK